MHLITVSQLTAQKRQCKVVALEHVERCYRLFVDVQRSTARLVEQDQFYLFNDVTVTDAGSAAAVQDDSKLHGESVAPTSMVEG